MTYSLYLHIPFCTHRCAYCDFNTYASQEGLLPAYVQALCKEIQVVAASAPQKIRAHTVFFGGGTPSLLSADQFREIFNAVLSSFDLTGDAEIGLEANPGTVSFDALRDLRRLGFNRISFGVQSAHPDELRQLERVHDYFDVVDAVRWSRRAGFENLNLDLIFGLPGQRLDRWQATVRLVLGLRPEHFSFYALTIEHGTPFNRWVRRGWMSMPDPDVAADMYEWAEEALSLEGYEHYEISNWAIPGRECRHNLQYWRGLPYLGFGAGAHGFAGGQRIANVLRIKTYIQRCWEPASLPFPISPATVSRQAIPPLVEMQEIMMTGLRLTQEGVSPAAFQARFGQGLQDVFGNEIDDLVKLGLLEWVDTPLLKAEEREGRTILRLTPRGRLLGNQVFMRFVG